MRSQRLPVDEQTRLKLRRPPGPPPVLPRLPRAEASPLPATPGRFAARRALLSRLTAGTLGTLPEPQRAPHTDPLVTLINRITNGFTLAEYERARALGYEAYLEEQLDPDALDDHEVEEHLSIHFPTLGMSPKELYDTYEGDNSAPYFQFKGQALVRGTNSKRQLFERMVEFWNDHFNIEHNKGIEWVFLPEHDRTVIRRLALGKFPELLAATAYSAAMLYYLDNWLNVRGEAQENYGREVMELHTLSVFGGYTEADVEQVSKCFTGWTLNDDPSSPDWMRGVYEPALHAPGKKFVLGHVIPETPEVRRPGDRPFNADAQAVLDILASHPSTAEFLAKKLLIRFLTPNPPQLLIGRVAQTYLDTKGDIKAMLRVILARENLRWSSPYVQPKFRRPFHFMTSIFRIFRAQVRNPALESLGYLESMAHMPFDWGPPTGYPDTVEAWGSSLLPRWGFATALIRPLFAGFSGVGFMGLNELKNLVGYQGPSDVPGLAQRINERLLGGVLPSNEQQILQDYMDNYPAAFDVHALFDSMALAASLPGFQWY